MKTKRGKNVSSNVQGVLDKKQTEHGLYWLPFSSQLVAKMY